MGYVGRQRGAIADTVADMQADARHYAMEAALLAIRLSENGQSMSTLRVAVRCFRLAGHGREVASCIWRASGPRETLKAILEEPGVHIDTWSKWTAQPSVLAN